MLSVDELSRGLVIDHVEAGKSMEIYRLLELSKLDCCIAIIKNVKSRKMGKKDIIKIEDVTDIDFDMLGYVAPTCTVNIIESSEIVEKKHLKTPARITNVIQCKNPRCISSTEQDLAQVFILSDGGKKVYRCLYCEQEHK